MCAILGIIEVVNTFKAFCFSISILISLLNLMRNLLRGYDGSTTHTEFTG